MGRTLTSHVYVFSVQGPPASRGAPSGWAEAGAPPPVRCRRAGGWSMALILLSYTLK
jgi:hypothetical protein